MQLPVFPRYTETDDAASESVRRKADSAFTRLTATLRRVMARSPRPLAWSLAVLACAGWVYMHYLLIVRTWSPVLEHRLSYEAARNGALSIPSPGMSLLSNALVALELLAAPPLIGLLAAARAGRFRPLVGAGAGLLAILVALAVPDLLFAVVFARAGIATGSEPTDWDLPLVLGVLGLALGAVGGLLALRGANSLMDRGPLPADKAPDRALCSRCATGGVT
jgi:hypothetical protein